MQLVIAAITTDPCSSSVAMASATATPPASRVAVGPPAVFLTPFCRSGSAVANEAFARDSGTRSCGRRGPARLGCTVPRSSSIVSVYTASGVASVRNRPCAFAYSSTSVTWLSSRPVNRTAPPLVKGDLYQARRSRPVAGSTALVEGRGELGGGDGGGRTVADPLVHRDATLEMLDGGVEASGRAGGHAEGPLGRTEAGDGQRRHDHLVGVRRQQVVGLTGKVGVAEQRRGLDQCHDPGQPRARSGER